MGATVETECLERFIEMFKAIVALQKIAPRQREVKRTIREIFSVYYREFPELEEAFDYFIRRAVEIDDMPRREGGDEALQEFRSRWGLTKHNFLRLVSMRG